MRVRILRGVTGDTPYTELVTVKEGTSVILLTPSVIEKVVYARFYSDKGELHMVPATDVIEVAPDETFTPLPVRYRDPDTGAVIAQNEAADAQDAKRPAPHEHETDHAGRQICTTSGDAPSKVRAEQTDETGQHKSYIVLCEDERKKGFVRPYRDAYKHVGRLEETRIGLLLTEKRRVGGCGVVTKMGRALSETYARDPTFYSATFCVQCNRHHLVAEFVWTADSQQVGS